MVLKSAQAERVDDSVAQLHRGREPGARRHRARRAQSARLVGAVGLEAAGGRESPAAARVLDVRRGRGCLARSGAAAGQLELGLAPRRGAHVSVDISRHISRRLMGEHFSAFLRVQDPFVVNVFDRRASNASPDSARKGPSRTSYDCLRPFRRLAALSSSERTL